MHQKVEKLWTLDGKVSTFDILQRVQFLDQSAIQFWAAPANLVQESQFPQPNAKTLCSGGRRCATVRTDSGFFFAKKKIPKTMKWRQENLNIFYFATPFYMVLQNHEKYFFFSIFFFFLKRWQYNLFNYFTLL